MWHRICTNLYLMWGNNISKHTRFPLMNRVENHSQTRVFIHSEEVLPHCCWGWGSKIKHTEKVKNKFYPTCIALPHQGSISQVQRESSQLTVPPPGEIKSVVTKKHLLKPYSVLPRIPTSLLPHPGKWHQHGWVSRKRWQLGTHKETGLKLNKWLLLAASGMLPMCHLRRMSCLSTPLQVAYWFSQTLCMPHFPTLLVDSFEKSGSTTTVGDEYLFFFFFPNGSKA